MRLFNSVVLASSVLALAAPAARADVKLHPLFSDNVVLQRGAPIPVFGIAEPGEAVAFVLVRPDGSSTTSKQPVLAGADGGWTITLPADLPPGSGYTLTVGGKNTVALKNVAVGEVWVCSGQSNVGMGGQKQRRPGKGAGGLRKPKLRLYTVKLKASPESLSYEGPGSPHRWEEAGPETVETFSAVAYHFGDYLQKHLPGDVPIGLIQTAWGGTPRRSVDQQGGPERGPGIAPLPRKAASSRSSRSIPPRPRPTTRARGEVAGRRRQSQGRREAGASKARKVIDPKNSQGSPSTLFNAMIHPLLGYPVRGAIWYQGESNAGRAAEYRKLIPTLISDWRAKSGAPVPFLIVQLAPFPLETPRE